MYLDHSRYEASRRRHVKGRHGPFVVFKALRGGVKEKLTPPQRAYARAFDYEQRSADRLVRDSVQ